MVYERELVFCACTRVSVGIVAPDTAAFQAGKLGVEIGRGAVDQQADIYVALAAGAVIRETYGLAQLQDYLDIVTRLEV